MKSFEYLLQLHPEKTGFEIMEIYKQELELDKQEKIKENEMLYKEVDRINKNGYFKGVFSSSQYYMYHFTNARVENDNIIADVEQITCFYTIRLAERFRLSSDDVNISIVNKTYQFIDIFHLNSLEEVTEKEYNIFKHTIESIVPTFFSKELEEKLKNFS